MNDPVKQTLLARVYDVAKETPLQKAQKLTKHLGLNVYLKREDLQPVHSFKIRGAYNKISQLTPTEANKGVIAASAGNHAQGVALSAQKLGLSSLIVMPKTTPQIKVDAVKSYGSEVVLHGDNYSEAAEYCKKLVEETGRTYIHPFDDPLVIAGQGTIGREVIEQLPDVTHIFVPVGGGGLIAGIAQFVKELSPNVKVIGVEPEDSSAMHQSLKENQRVVLDHVGIFADGVAVKQVGELTFDIVRKYVDEIITVSTDQTCASMQFMFEETRNIVEPSGALALAGVVTYFLNQQQDNLQDVKAVAICSGANISFERLQFVAERTLIGSGKESLFMVTMPEKPGALLHFCKEVINGYSISEFNYRLRVRGQAHIFVGIRTSSVDDKQTFMDTMKRHEYEHIDLSHDEVVKEHIRHMIGGQSPEAKNEIFYIVEFPERPRALYEFLDRMRNVWNISLFHYRGQGGDIGRVMIGYETDDKSALESELAKTGVKFSAVQNDIVDLFL